MAVDDDRLARRVADAMLSREGTGPAWKVEIEEARSGYARVRMTIRPDMANGHGIAHGGMIFALADTAFAYACNSRNAITVAQHGSISFLSPVQVGETLVAEAVERAREGRSGVYAVQVRAGEGRIVAEFQGLSRETGGMVIEP
ncbi:hydroxyphenylacetyl-CoA thioesterase PaaI [Sphingomonas xanthus]|uniref:Hydroxyphenylacetyl-CoA thioesterase PaaI n=1 Tax=Sphingomonas xanthus TaxID=2594473 RepID=A0A516ISB9_9SPHN|nr:hydroxyphenylacetyl-CoA thioesterase PaaI [Sphingomonas xanthus]QDP19714.1 hydroxyphenylacetyl-CoA thioesterase PaaI [Sphingomonas xanthus]